MIGPFSIDAVFPAFPLIGASFQVDGTALQQLISVYLITYAVMSLFHGAISDAIGRKPVMVAGMLLYALASVGAALSTSFVMLLVCRGLQGVSAGAGLVVGRAVIRDSLEGPAAQRLMSQVMMIFGVAPVIAPMIGALLLPLGGWHGIFWLLAGFTLLLALALQLFLDETHPPSQRTRFAPRPLLADYTSFGRDRLFWPLLKAAQGHVVNIIGGAARTVEPEFLIGGSVNSAFSNFSKGLAQIGNRDDVNVNVIHPGMTETDRVVTLFNAHAKAQGKTPEQIREESVGKAGLRRIGQP